MPSTSRPPAAARVRKCRTWTDSGRSRCVRVRGVVIAWIALAGLSLFPRPATAQNQPSEKLLINGKGAATWNEGATGIVQVEGPVVIELDRATLKAKQAVLWITEDP